MIKVMIITKLLCSLFGVSFEDNAACWQDLSNPDIAFMCNVDSPKVIMTVLLAHDGTVEVMGKAE